MKELQYKKEILSEIDQVMSSIDDDQVNALVDAILDAPQVFVAGAGRSGLSSKAFAMRMMHMGLPAYVLGEIVTPNFNPGDLLIVCSGSGETKGQLMMAEKAVGFGGDVALLTIAPGSTIGQLAKTQVHITAPTPKLSEQTITSIQPMASLFEQCLLLVLDVVILKLMDRKGMDADTMFARHTNFE